MLGSVGVLCAHAPCPAVADLLGALLVDGPDAPTITCSCPSAPTRRTRSSSTTSMRWARADSISQGTRTVFSAPDGSWTLSTRRSAGTQQRSPPMSRYRPERSRAPAPGPHRPVGGSAPSDRPLPTRHEADLRDLEKATNGPLKRGSSSANRARPTPVGRLFWPLWIRAPLHL